MLSPFFQPTSTSMSKARVRATSRPPFSSPSSCLGHELCYLQAAILWLSIGPGVSRPGGDHPCTFWSVVDPRGSHSPEELLSSFGIWNNSTSKSTKTNKVSELKCIVTQMSLILAKLILFWLETRAWLIQFVRGMFDFCLFCVCWNQKDMPYSYCFISRSVICSSVLQRWNLIEIKHIKTVNYMTGGIGSL